MFKRLSLILFAAISFALNTSCMQSNVMQARIPAIGSAAFSDYERVRLPKHGNNLLGELIGKIESPKPYMAREDIADEVEAIFQELKKRLNTNKASYMQDVVLQPNPLSYPIDQQLKTQSLNHIRFLYGNEHIDHEMIRKLTEDASYLPIVENALQQEILYSKDYWVFYHAHENYLACLHDILKLFYSWGFLRKNQPLPLRFVTKGKYPSNLDAFLDQTSSLYKPTHHEGHRNLLSYMFDKTPEIREQLISVNLALFGNSTALGESTFSYLKFPKCWHDIGIKEILQAIFQELQLPQIFLDKIMQATNTFEDNKQMILLQIFIKKDVVDNVAYWAFPGGSPVTRELLDSWDETKKRHTKISPLLAQYVENPQELDKYVSLFNYKNISRYDDLGLDALQARLWLPSNYLYDPSKTKILRYGIDMSHYAHYLALLNDIFEEMVKYFIQQKLTDQTALFQHANSPWAFLDELMSNYKLSKDARRLSRIADYNNLEVSSNQELSNAEDKFLQLARVQQSKQVSRGANLKKGLN